MGETVFITRLKLEYFGKFSGREIELKPGINIIYGENEAGKSTVHAFIKGMLFGIERLRGRGAASKEDIYTRYLPWDYPGAYGGQMDIRVGDKLYRLIRSFHANNRSFTVTDLETGREVNLAEGHISELIPGLNEATFRNTISIEQLKARTDAELAAQVRNYITNLSIAKSREVNVEKAVELLKQKKKSLETASIRPELENLAMKIKEGTEKEKRTDSLNESLSSLAAERDKLIKELDMMKLPEMQREEKLMEELPAIMEKYHTYNEFSRQYAQLKDQSEKLKEKIAGIENEAAKAEALKKDLDEARILEADFLRYKEAVNALNREREEHLRSTRIKGLFYWAFSVIFTVAACVLTKSLPLTLGLFSVLLIAGGVIHVILKRNIKKAGSSIRIKETKELCSKAEDRIKKILGTYHAASLAELAEKQEDCLRMAVSLEHEKELLNELNKRLEALEDNCDNLHDTIMLYMRNFISTEELTPQAVEKLKETVNTKKKESEMKYSQLKSRLDDINLKIEKINWELSAMEDNENELITNRKKYEELLRKQKENETEISAVELAIDTIRELSVTIHDSFGKNLNRAVSDIISGVTGGKYQDIKVDEDLNVKLGWNDNYIILNRLSAGTIDQVYFALRLAVADMLLGGDNMPLILDDTFALYDDNRLKSAIRQISDCSQVLIFTCQMREKKITEEMGLPFNFIRL